MVLRQTVTCGGVALLCSWPGLAAAQIAPEQAATPTPTRAPSKATADSQGVLVYPAAFFASSNPNTAYDMISRLPGFTLDIGDQGSRGLAGTAGNVLIDGARPSSKSDTLFEILQRIAVSSVDRIELIRGGAPGIDMRGRAVVANVVLKRTRKTEIVFEPSLFFYTDGFIGKTAKTSYTQREGERQTEASVSATLDRSANDAQGRRQRTDASGASIQNAALALGNHTDIYDARAAIQRPLFGGSIHANVVIDYNVSHDAQAIRILTGSGDDEFTRERTRYPNGEFGFTWTRSPGPRSTIEITGLQRLNRTLYSGAFESAGSTSVFTITATGGESVLRATDTFRPSSKLSFEGGGEVAYNFLRSASNFTQDGTTIPLPNASIFVNELRGEGFAKATWKPASKVTVEGEIRVEVSRISETGDTSRSRTFTYPKPRLQVTWLPGEGHQIRLRIEKQVGQLNFSDFAASTEIALGTVAGGNADLRPDQSTVYEAVYERRFWKKGSLELTASHTELSDVTDIIPLVGGFDAVGNIGGGTDDFVGAKLTLPFDKLGLKNALFKGGVGWAWSRVIDPLTGQPRRLARQQPFQCDFSFSQDIKGGRYSFGLSHDCNVDRLQSYRSNEIRLARYDPYFSIYGQWKPSSKLTVRVDLANLTNSQTEGIRDIYTGPRNVAPFLYREDRTTRRGQNVYLQVRKVF